MTSPELPGKIHELGLPPDLLGTVVALLLRGEGAAAGDLVRAHRAAAGDFFEEDEPVAEVQAAFNRAEKHLTAEPLVTKAGTVLMPEVEAALAAEAEGGFDLTKGTGWCAPSP